MNAESLDQLRVWLPALRTGLNGSLLIERAIASVRRLGGRLRLQQEIDEPVWPQLTGYPFGPAQS